MTITGMSGAGTAIMTATITVTPGDGNWDRDHYRGVPYAPGYAYGQRGYIPPNGQGMIDLRNPNLYWACDSHGHHCHWAPRY
jgi:hypothetical protein